MPYRAPFGDPIESPAEPAGIVRASIDIAAPPADVFRALADPRELAAWLGGQPASAPHPDADRDSTSPSAPLVTPRDASGAPASPLDRPPTRWASRVAAPDGTVGTVSGEYGYAAPPHVLETSWRASWSDYALERVRFELTPIDVGGVAGTRVTVTHTRAAARLLAPSSAYVAGRAAEGDVWRALLARLAVHVAMAGTLARWGARAGAEAEAFDVLHRAVVELHHAH